MSNVTQEYEEKKKTQTKAKQKQCILFWRRKHEEQKLLVILSSVRKHKKSDHSTKQNSRESEPLSYMWSLVHGSIHRVWGLRDLTATSVWEGPVWDRGESHLCG